MMLTGIHRYFRGKRRAEAVPRCDTYNRLARADQNVRCLERWQRSRDHLELSTEVSSICVWY